MGFLSIFSILRSIFGFFKSSKYFNIKNISIVVLVGVLGYGYLRINSLEKDIVILNSNIKTISSDRDACKETNRSNIEQIDNIKKDYNKNEAEYINRIKSRDKMIVVLRKDIKLAKKTLNQKPTKEIIIKECKIPIIEGKDIKDEEFKDLYNSISTIGR